MKILIRLIPLILAFSVFQISAKNRGIKNQNGNDCFMNASIQALSHISDFRKSYAEIKDLKEFQECTPLKTFFDYINELQKNNPEALSGSQVFRVYWTNPNNYIEADNSTLENLQSGQQDAQEFISAILNILNFYFIKLISETKNDQINNPINSIKFKLINLTQRNCGHDTFKIDDSSMLKLEIPEIKLPEGQTYPDIIDYFNKYSEPENMSGDNQLTCPICSEKNGALTKVDGTKCLKFFTLPKILMISFCRFAFGGMDYKINTPVTFPNKLIMNKKSSILDENITEKLQTKQITYNLFAIVCHGGGTGGGHYWAYGKDSDGNWYKYNDSIVTQINQPELNNVLNQKSERGTPYILFYELEQAANVKPEATAIATKEEDAKKKFVLDEAKKKALEDAKKKKSLVDAKKKKALESAKKKKLEVIKKKKALEDAKKKKPEDTKKKKALDAAKKKKAFEEAKKKKSADAKKKKLEAIKKKKEDAKKNKALEDAKKKKLEAIKRKKALEDAKKKKASLTKVSS